jgi:hypothetical protein
MKNIIPLLIFLAAIFFIPHNLFSQTPAPYHVPDTYTFDYEVVQQVKSKSGSPQLITYYYSQNGDYMAITAKDKKGIMIYTKEGVSVIVDNDKKSIVLMRLGNLIGDLGKAYTNQKKNNPSAASDSSGKSKAAKTGNTKQICGYTAEEYSYTNSKGETGSMWCAKVDFNASMFLMGMAASVNGKSPMGKMPAGQDYPSFNDPHMLVAEVKSATHPDDGITTQSISKKTTTINTKDYKINDMSNMNLQQMMEMQPKQNN